MENVGRWHKPCRTEEDDGLRLNTVHIASERKDLFVLHVLLSQIEKVKLGDILYSLCIALRILWIASKVAECCFFSKLILIKRFLRNITIYLSTLSIGLVFAIKLNITDVVDDVTELKVW